MSENLTEQINSKSCSGAFKIGLSCHTLPYSEKEIEGENSAKKPLKHNIFSWYYVIQNERIVSNSVSLDELFYDNQFLFSSN